MVVSRFGFDSKPAYHTTAVHTVRFEFLITCCYHQSRCRSSDIGGEVEHMDLVLLSYHFEKVKGIFFVKHSLQRCSGRLLYKIGVFSTGVSNASEGVVLNLRYKKVDTPILSRASTVIS